MTPLHFPPTLLHVDYDINVDLHPRFVSYTHVLYLVNHPSLLCSICLTHLFVVLPLFTIVFAYCVLNLLYSITSEYRLKHTLA